MPLHDALRPLDRLRVERLRMEAFWRDMLDERVRARPVDPGLWHGGWDLVTEPPPPTIQIIDCRAGTMAESMTYARNDPRVATYEEMLRAALTDHLVARYNGIPPETVWTQTDDLNRWGDDAIHPRNIRVQARWPRFVRSVLPGTATCRWCGGQALHGLELSNQYHIGCEDAALDAQGY